MYTALTTAFGPVFAKEAVEMARRKRFYLNRCLYGLVLVAILLGFTAEYSGRLNVNDPQARRMMAQAASELFVAVNVIQFLAVFVLVPVFTSTVIAGEREANTLELLFTTNLTDRQIVVCKLASRLVAMGTLVLSGLPVLSCVLFFGGVDPGSLWRTTAVTLLAAVFVGAHAVYFSAVTRSPLGALVRTYWWLAVVMLAVPGALMLPAFNIRALNWFTVDRAIATVALVNPAVLFMSSMDGSHYERVTAAVGDWYFPAAFVLPAAWSAFLIGRAMRHVRREPVPFALPAGVRRLVAWASTFRPKHRDFRSWGIVSDGNPLWVRAHHAPVYDRDGHVRRIQAAGWPVAATFFLLFLALDSRELRQEELSIAFGGFAWGGVMLLAVVLSGGSLAGDRRRGFLDLVLVTPLTGQEVIDGTMLAVWEHLRRIVWLPVLLAAVFCLTGASLPHGAVCSVITATLFVSLVVLYGVGFSLSARSVPVGLAAAFAFPLAVTIGTGILIANFEEDHALVLWVITAGLFIAGRWWVRRNASCGAVFCYLLALHLVIAGLATAWTTDFRRDQYPGAAMNAAFLTAVMLDDNFSREFRPWPALVILGCYWTALVLNFVWARRWLIRHFDRLAGRV